MFMFVLACLAVLASGCSVHKGVVSAGDKKLGREISSQVSLEDHQWGFALYDPENGEWLYTRNEDQYFTPASNTKILTLYTSLQLLGDRSEALRYSLEGDTLFFWGTGDPSFMYHVADSNIVLDFLRQHDGVLAYVPGQEIEKYGPGWAWDDYGYSFQVERSVMPVYGNRLTFQKLASNLEGEVRPRYFREFVVEDADQDRFASRLAEANAFGINPSLIDEYPFERSVPFMVSDYDIAGILSEELGRNVELAYAYDGEGAYEGLQGVPIDSLLKRMMYDSDNFIAEQLLIMCANQIGDDLSPEVTIDSMQESYFATSPDRFQWYDGSGLSRYNLFTPRSLVWLLSDLYSLKGMDYLQEIFPAGGENGTIEDWYASEEGTPYIYAKTGTLRNKHCLSGYLITRSGRVLIFSFMHNNFVGGSITVKGPMQTILNLVYEKY